MANKENKEKYVLGKVATQTDTVFIDTETEEQLDLYTMLVKIANTQEELKKKLL